jgi:hypothetical protein
MHALFRVALSFHVAAGIIGLAAFWTPAISRKGGAAHVHVGRVFYKATCVIAITGLAMALLMAVAPLAVHPLQAGATPEQAAAVAAKSRMAAPFLLYLVLITFAPVHHGIGVLRTREAPERLATPFHTAVAMAAIGMSVVMIGLALWAREPVFAALSPIGVLTGRGNLRFAQQPSASRMAWWYEHMGSMLGGGIAFHTAFLVVGAGPLIGTRLTGFAAVVPWILPSIVGIPATAIWVAYYRRKFRDAAPLRPAPQAVPRPS